MSNYHTGDMIPESIMQNLPQNLSEILCSLSDILTFSFLPLRPVIEPSLASTTFDVSTSPEPVASYRSSIFGLPSGVV